MTPVRLPAALEQQRRLGPDWARWLDRLPRLAADLLAEWEVTPDGPALHGHCSLVLPVVADAGPAALKITFDGDGESEHEALALQHWRGDGAVRLLRADPHRRALLLERLGPADLGDVPEIEACEVVGGLYGRLHAPAPPPLRLLSEYVDRWLTDLAGLPREAPLPRRMVEQALHTGHDLLRDPESTGVIVHGDLHYANVLSGGREPWLAIDPKPMSGDPHYEPAPLLWNRWDEVAGDVRRGLRRRFHAVVDAAGLDEDRARAWVLVRTVVNAGWSVGEAGSAGRELDAGERAWITRCLAVAKAVQD